MNLVFEIAGVEGKYLLVLGHVETEGVMLLTLHSVLPPWFPFAELKKKTKTKNVTKLMWLKI